MARQTKSSWEASARWYDSKVGDQGHYYHENVIFPNLLPLMALDSSSRVLDLACGQGILARCLPAGVSYVGVDISKSLIEAAKKRSRDPLHQFFMRDITKSFSLKPPLFTHATIILALQNVESPLDALKNSATHLDIGGKLFIVLNHPCFRIPRQSHWQIDEGKKIQYRRLDSYLTPQKIPIQMHPGKKGSEQTVSFHRPLSRYMHILKEAGFFLEDLVEWTSDKKSDGPKARMENRARKEFPLFLTLCAVKKK